MSCLGDAVAQPVKTGGPGVVLCIEVGMCICMVGDVAICHISKTGHFSFQVIGYPKSFLE